MACLDLVTYSFLYRWASLGYLIAHTLSRGLGGMVNFTVNRRWTFGCHGPADFWPHLARFGMVYLLSYGGSSGFLWFFIEVGRLGAVQAKIAAEGATFLFNFFALRVWAFRPASAFTIRRPTCDIAIRAGSLLRK